MQEEVGGGEVTQISFASKSIRFLFALSSLIVILATMYGWSIDETLNSVLLSLLPASFLIEITALISLFALPHDAKISQTGWLILSMVALGTAYLFCNRPIDDAFKDGETVLTYVMLILSFPFGLLIPFILAKTSTIVNGADPNIRLLIEWLCFFTVGYLQWFVLLPQSLNKKFRQH